jgi:hypothetical protein
LLEETGSTEDEVKPLKKKKAPKKKVAPKKKAAPKEQTEEEMKE